MTAQAAPAVRRTHVVEMRFTDVQWLAIQSAATQRGYKGNIGEWLAVLALGQVKRGDHHE